MITNYSDYQCVTASGISFSGDIYPLRKNKNTLTGEDIAFLIEAALRLRTGRSGFPAKSYATIRENMDRNLIHTFCNVNWMGRKFIKSLDLIDTETVYSSIVESELPSINEMLSSAIHDDIVQPETPSSDSPLDLSVIAALFENQKKTQLILEENISGKPAPTRDHAPWQVIESKGGKYTAVGRVVLSFGNMWPEFVHSGHSDGNNYEPCTYGYDQTDYATVTSSRSSLGLRATKKAHLFFKAICWQYGDTSSSTNNYVQKIVRAGEMTKTNQNAVWHDSTSAQTGYKFDLSLSLVGSLIHEMVDAFGTKFSHAGYLNKETNTRKQLTMVNIKPFIVYEMNDDMKWW